MPPRCRRTIHHLLGIHVFSYENLLIRNFNFHIPTKLRNSSTGKIYVKKVLILIWKILTYFHFFRLFLVSYYSKGTWSSRVPEARGQHGGTECPFQKHFLIYPLNLMRINSDLKLFAHCSPNGISTFVKRWFSRLFRR